MVVLWQGQLLTKLRSWRSWWNYCGYAILTGMGSVHGLLRGLSCRMPGTWLIFWVSTWVTQSQIGTKDGFWDIWRKKQDFLASDSIENHPPTTTQSTWYTPYAAANVPTTTPKRTEKVWYLKIENWKYKSTLFNQHTPKINLCEFCASLFTSQPGIKEGTPPPHQHHHSRWNSVVQCYMPIVYAISKEKEHLTQYLSFLHLFYWFLHILCEIYGRRSPQYHNLLELTL